MIRTRVLLADDHAIVAEGLRRILGQPEFDVVGVVADGRALLQAAAELKPDVIVTDVAMPLMNGVDAARQIHKQNPRVKIVFLTMHPEPIYATSALAAGASGYVLKTAAADELMDAVRAGLKGKTYVSKSIRKSVGQAHQTRSAKRISLSDQLTERQREVLQLLAEGRQAKEVGAVLNLSAKTVEFHKYRIMKALGAKSVAELARYALKHGLIA